MKRIVILALVTGVTLWSGVLVLADDSQSGAADAKNEVRKMWNIDRMIDQAASNVARRYNLSETQEGITREMFRERVNGFLESHEEAIWPLIRDLARQQFAGKPFDPNDPDALATAKRIGEMAAPIVEKAREAILDANSEWGDILTEEQHRLHEYDLREMETQFEQIRKNFKDYQEGTPRERYPMFPPYTPKADEPARPARPSDSLLSNNQAPEHEWDKYVKEFIAKYELDPGQTATAQSVLRELKDRATTYRAKNKAKFEAVEKQFSEAKVKGDYKKRMKALRDEKALYKPIEKTFEELKERLNRQLSPAQRKKHDPAGQGKKTTKSGDSSPKATDKPAQGTGK